MLSMFNDTIKTAARVTYSQQLSELINGIGVSEISAESIIVISVNLVLAAALFLLAYRKNGLE